MATLASYVREPQKGTIDQLVGAFSSALGSRMIIERRKKKEQPVG